MRTQDAGLTFFLRNETLDDKICVKNFHVNATDLKKNYLKGLLYEDIVVFCASLCAPAPSP